MSLPHLNLASRQLHGELMDDPALDTFSHARALHGLRRINTITNSYRALWNPIRELARKSSRPLRVLDVACGGGDTLLALAKQANREKLRLEFIGLDISPTATSLASERLSSSPLPCWFVIGDALSQDYPRDCDVIFCSLFLHHLTDARAQTLLQRMSRAAGELVLVSDLLRTKTGYAYAYLGTRLLSRSRIVHVDGPRSVEAAFSQAEIEQLASAAGMKAFSVKRFWPERFLLSWQPGRASEAL